MRPTRIAFAGAAFFAPFRGFRLRGEVAATMVGGRIVMRRGEGILAEAGGAEVGR